MTMITDNLPAVLAGVSFLAVLVFFLVLSSILSVRRRERELLDRARKWSGREGDKAGQGMLAGLSGLAGGKKGTEDGGGIYADTPLFYQRAGIYNKTKIRVYQIIRLLLLVLPAVVIAAILILAGRPVTVNAMLYMVFLGYVGYLLPRLWLRLVAFLRKKELNRTFPDAMDLLMVCVESGLGVDSAIRRVSQEIHVTSPELAKEFKILSLELKSGKYRNDCLRNLAKRADLPDVESLVSLLIQAEKYGTGVANALRIHAEEMRQRRYSRMEELAAKLPVKLIVPLILFIFPALFVVIAGPVAIQVLRVIIQR